jgi:hypothetical protein
MISERGARLSVPNGATGVQQIEYDTRIWLDNEPVVFVTWTADELIYTREGYKDTLIRLPRRTVLRMLQVGSLRLEGFRPDWVTAGRNPLLL